jgi:hypothetical protein
MKLSKPDLSMKRLRDYALAGIVLLNVIATVVAFGESYAGLYRWAFEHGVQGFWAAVWPMMVDLIILVAELGLFVAHYDKWLLRHKAWLWFVMMTALAVSTGGNTGHVHTTDWLSRLTAALPPVALMFTTTVGFGVMKRVFGAKKPSQLATEILTETGLTTHTERPAETLTERSHLGTESWIESPAVVAAFEPGPTEHHHSHGNVWMPAEGETETKTEPAELDTDDLEAAVRKTVLDLGYKPVKGKSFLMPRDRRANLGVNELRVRDMYDVDPDITANAIKEKLGIAWATADKYLKATKEARAGQ